MKNHISTLLINPWIIDFAAYNLWAEPLGLLYIASILKKAGARISYINCLASVRETDPRPKKNGCSKYIRRVIQKPECLSFIKRNYAVYGIDEEEFISRLRAAEKPDAVLVTSIMTYWYPGVFKAIKLVKEVYGDKMPVILGGIYSKLCPDHAKNRSAADFVYTDENPAKLLRLIEQISCKRFKYIPSIETFSDYPHPLHELQKGAGFFSILTRRGCPYTCSYCASGILSSRFSGRSASSIISEMKRYTEILGVKNIAFYDDALLVDSEHHTIPILKNIIRENPGISIHLPNGIHSSLMTKKIAELFFQAGVTTIRIGFETSNRRLQNKTGNKTTNRDFRKAVAFLREAGYKKKDIGVYIMAGLPGQTAKNVEASINFVYDSGASPFLSYFSPIPGTKIWPESVLSNTFLVEKEPLLQNNTVFILGNKNFSEQAIQHLKDISTELRLKTLTL